MHLSCRTHPDNLTIELAGSIPVTLPAMRAAGEALAVLPAGATVRVVGCLRPEEAGPQTAAAIAVNRLGSVDVSAQ